MVISMSEAPPCTNCNGNGIVPGMYNTHIDCPVCKGSGEYCADTTYDDGAPEAPKDTAQATLAFTGGKDGVVVLNLPDDVPVRVTYNLDSMADMEGDLDGLFGDQYKLPPYLWALAKSGARFLISDDELFLDKVMIVAGPESDKLIATLKGQGAKEVRFDEPQEIDSADMSGDDIGKFKAAWNDAVNIDTFKDVGGVQPDKDIDSAIGRIKGHADNIYWMARTFDISIYGGTLTSLEKVDEMLAAIEKCYIVDISIKEV